MSQLAVTVLIVLGVFVFVIAIVALIIVAVRKQKKLIADLGEDTPLAQALRKPGRKFEATHGEVSYEYQYSPGGQNSPSSFVVTVACPSDGAFKVRKESKFDRASKQIGLTREIQTGDAEFDDELFIQTNKGEFAAAFLDSAVKRRATQFLLRLGFTMLRHNGKTMQAIWTPFAVKKDLDPSFLLDAASLLGVLAKDMPEISPVSALGGRDPGAWKVKAVTAFAVPILADTFGALFLILGLTRYTPLDPGRIFLDSLIYSLPLFAVFCWLAVGLLKGRSTSHIECMIVLSLALVGFPLAGAGSEIFLNGYLDRAPATPHVARVVGKYISRSKDSVTYRVVVDSWREGRDTEKLKVGRALYDIVTEGRSAMKVVTRPGRFGFEWLVSSEIAP